MGFHDDSEPKRSPMLKFLDKWIFSMSILERLCVLTKYPFDIYRFLADWSNLCSISSQLNKSKPQPQEDYDWYVLETSACLWCAMRNSRILELIPL
jgi:hypothetical protein